MRILIYINDIDEYLEATDVVDYDNDTIQKLVSKLWKIADSELNSNGILLSETDSG